MAASGACSNPHVFAHTLRFSARGFLALTKNAGFLEVPLSSSSLMFHVTRHECLCSPVRGIGRASCLTDFLMHRYSQSLTKLVCW